jgi:ABC-type dipeptide/oligopeptide/nickel transport system permease subunit
VIGLLVLLAIVGGPLAEWITGHGINEPFTNMTDDYGLPKGPNGDFWFGADTAGRDLFVRTMYGARTSMIVGVVASGLAVLIGLVVGLVAGYFGGWVDTALSRFSDVVLAIPQLLISIGIVAACSTSKEGCVAGLIQPGLTVVIAVIVLFSWPYVARVVRGNTLSIREKEYVEASRSLGASSSRIVFRDILPNLVAPVIVLATLLVPGSILFEAALSYLGLGVVPPASSWGQTLADAKDLYDTAWWLMVFPGVLLVLTTLAFNLLGDGLRDALDVRSDR